MTDHLINALSRRGLARTARPAIALLLALALAYGGVAWLAVLHAASGATGPEGAPGVVVWARAATIAVPLMFAVAWIALCATRRLLERAMAQDSKRLGNVLVVTLSALLGALALGVASPIVGWLLGVAGGAYDGSPLILVIRDTVLAMPATLLLAAVVTAGVARGVPWAAVDAVRTGVRRTRQRRVAFQAGLVVVLLAPLTLLAQGAAQRAIAQTGPGTPCPVGAPVKTFAINAINVDIPLNRFGDHDPSGKMYVLDGMEAAVRAEETSRHVSIGLRDDPIQPLVIRANVGDCVEVAFTNKTNFQSRPGGVQVPSEVGVHIDGLAFQSGSSGDAVGENPATSVAPGGSTTYRYYIPNDPALEGAHYLRPGPNNRQDVSHGLFGQLVVEPAGSRYLHPDTGAELPAGGWGWEATIVPAGGKSFREVNLIHHEVGDELYKIPTTSSDLAPVLPVKDPVTLSYRPGSRALNYRSEPFTHRLSVEAQHRMKAYSYNSYTFGDPSTPMPRGYLGDPMKIRLTHGGSELFHVYHLHGGGDRWRVNPHADKSYKYSDTGLNKTPIPLSASQRLDSQSIGPGESYNLEIEGGSGGVQQSAGDFLFHCHIAEHYVSGMWSVWRVYDTRQPDFAALPDRPPLPLPVDSTGLIGRTMPDGSVITAGNLDKWVEPQLPPQGVAQKAAGDPISLDGAVWDWKRGTGANANVYYGTPEDATGVFAGSPWLAAGRYPNLTGPDDQLTGTGRTSHAFAGHPGLLPIDAGYPVSGDGRPRILFNPVNGRPAHPLLRTQIGQRPPYTANGHTGAPWLGERANKQPDQPGVPDPWAGRADALCPATSPDRHFNIVSIQKPIQVTKAGAYDQFGKIYVLAKNKDKVRNGSMPSEPLAIRANIGDCVTLTATSEQTPDDPNQPFPMMNLHIHHVQFDPGGSDGATAGMTYGQAVRPYRLEDGQIVDAVQPGATTLTIKPTLDQPFLTKYRVGIFVGVGLGTETLEVAKITAVTPVAGSSNIVVTLDRRLKSAHAADEYAGTEYVQEIWYPDVVLDNIFWHDHVDGIHNWGHGLVGQLIIEPKGSTYHDPTTGEQVDSGTQVDVHTNDPLAPGLVDGSFREFVLWTIDQNPGGGDATVNLRAEPFSDRKAANPDPSLLFSSATHGDPFTPLPRAYAGDPFVIRTINVSSTVDTLRVDGHKYFAENRMLDGSGKLLSSPLSGIVYGVSERFSLIFKGGAGGERKQSGDFLYANGLQRREVQGAWGLIRVLPRQVGDLRPLPGSNVPTGPTPANPAPDRTTRPPEATDAGDPCPVGAPARAVDVSAIDVPGAVLGRTIAYVPSADADAVLAGAKSVEPLVIHAAAGECLSVRFTNRRAPSAGDPSQPRASMHVAKLVRDVRSSGINIGFNPEQTVVPGQSREYRFYVDDAKLGTAIISDTGGDDTGAQGMYGAVQVAPPGAVFTDPVTGARVNFGTRVDVTVPGRPSYRDLTAFMGDNDPVMGTNTMPYPVIVAGPALFNYGSELGRPLNAAQFSSNLNGDPHTVWSVYSGDAMHVHVVGAPGSEQTHVFNLGGHTWAWDADIPNSEQLANQSFGPHTTIDAVVRGGAGAPGDYFVGNIRRPFTDAGQWGILRVLPAPSGAGPIRKLAPQSGSPAPDPLPIPQADQTPLQSPVQAVIAGAAQTETRSTTTTSPRVRLLGPLRVPVSITSRALASRGLSFSLTAPKATRAARVKVFRVVGKRKIVVSNQVLQVVRRPAKMTKAVQARVTSITRSGEIKVSTTGLVTGVWRPSAIVLKALRTGPYLVEVQTGATTTTFLAERAQGTTRVRVVAAPASRTSAPAGRS